MIFTLQSVAMVVLALPVMAGYICRLDAMSWRTVRPQTILFHMAGLLYCGGCVLDAGDGIVEPSAWAGIVMCALWLRESWPTWKDGPPPHTLSKAWVRSE